MHASTLEVNVVVKDARLVEALRVWLRARHETRLYSHHSGAYGAHRDLAQASHQLERACTDVGLGR